MSNRALSKSQNLRYFLRLKLRRGLDAAVSKFRRAPLPNCDPRIALGRQRSRAVRKAAKRLAAAGAIALLVGQATGILNKNELPNTLEELKNNEQIRLNQGPRNNFTFVSPPWENEKATWKTIWNWAKGDKKGSDYNEVRYNIAVDNVEQLNKDLQKYSNINSKQALDSLSEDEKLDYIRKYIGLQLETQNIIFYGKSYTQEEKQEALKNIATLESLFYKQALGSILKEIETDLDALAMTPSPIEPEAFGLKITAGKIAALGSSKLAIITSAKVGNQILEQSKKQAAKDATRFIETRILKELEENASKGLATAASKKIDPTIIAKSKNGIILEKGSRKAGFDHIVMRHLTGEYVKEGVESTYFPKSMTRKEIVDLVMNAVETVKPKIDARGGAIIEKKLSQPLNGCNAIRVIMFEEAGVLKISTAYPIVK